MVQKQLVLLRFSKGFYFYTLCIRILSSVSINNQSFLWFKSYLFDRQQVLKVNDVRSNENLTNDYGVPRGRVLGTIFFILYINAVCDLNVGISVILG